MQNLLDIAISGVRLGGEVLMDHFGSVKLAQADVKSAGDYVSGVDRRSEEVLREFYQRELPGSVFLGEEFGQAHLGGDYRWIVDPLDGTTNYLQGLPIFGVSVALEKTIPGKAWGELIVGVVLHPPSGDIWTALKGQGAGKNGKQISVGNKTDLSNCLIGTGFPFRTKGELDDYMKTFEEICRLTSGIRRPGAASLDLCWTAEGVFDGFWEHGLSPWDIAAGALIIKEAGGLFTSFTGDENFLATGNVVGGNPHIHARMLEIIQRTVSRLAP
ncbi:MAG: inositol monophosphatase family protein [bacterium]|nr:inositol monophosphatase family protein [bacterium]